MLALSALDALVTMCRMLGKKPKFLYDIPIEDEVVIKGFKRMMSSESSSTRAEPCAW
jgi:hypothetical protein